jgi:pyruvate-formate lyase-activating enzyme
MNSKLIDGKYKVDAHIMKNLKKDVDHHKPEMIFVSGGEPTLNSLLLFNATSIFKSWGCKVGMSTNGTNPEVLKKFISGYKKIDYVALDLKGNAEVYKSLGDSEYFMRVLASWVILREEQKSRPEFDYEIRTTWYPPFITRGVLLELSTLFHNDEKWVLQQFRQTSNMPDRYAKTIKPCSEGDLQKMCEVLKKEIPKTTVRYV